MFLIQSNPGKFLPGLNIFTGDSVWLTSGQVVQSWCSDTKCRLTGLCNYQPRVSSSQTFKIMTKANTEMLLPDHLLLSPGGDIIVVTTLHVSNSSFPVLIRGHGPTRATRHGNNVSTKWYPTPGAENTRTQRELNPSLVTDSALRLCVGGTFYLYLCMRCHTKCPSDAAIPWYYLDTATHNTSKLIKHRTGFKRLGL